MARRQCSIPSKHICDIRIRTDYQSSGTLPRNLRKSRIDILVAADIQKQDVKPDDASRLLHLTDLRPRLRIVRIDEHAD